MKEVHCPNCGAKRFLVVAHVTQEWEVNEQGDFIDVTQDCIDVTHKPNEYDLWECKECGEEFTPHETKQN